MNDSRIYLKGNIFPLSNRKEVYLKNKAPIDSVYEATVSFPATANNEELEYNFFIYKSDKNEVQKEQMSRHLKLRQGDRDLDALYFDSFAW
ncbi:MAG: hypothetical protein PVI44_12890 [Balneolaceae bacterium]|jgi:hypothetical protein